MVEVPLIEALLGLTASDDIYTIIKIIILKGVAGILNMS
jgi:hypothetical protein